jgi:DNA/RNA-binding domain of Phe-tRNA-synthetase-like protein
LSWSNGVSPHELELGRRPATDLVVAPRVRAGPPAGVLLQGFFCRASAAFSDAVVLTSAGALILLDGNVMHFEHSTEIWRDFPELVAGVLFAEGITPDVSVKRQVARYEAVAAARLASVSEGEFPEVRAWRRAFSTMGLKPTRYRSASEALLRRFRREGSLPRLHPLVDVCNAISLAFAIPVAVFDVSKIAARLEVRYATGEEWYLAFSGESERPEVGEVIFADAADRVHARRWTNRQSAYAAVTDATRAVLIVAEAMHDAARPDITRLTEAVAAELQAMWSVDAKVRVLSPSDPLFDL